MKQSRIYAKSIKTSEVFAVNELTDVKKGDLLTFPQAEQELGFEESKFRHWRKLNGLDPTKFPIFTKLGGTVYVVRKAFVELVNQGLGQ